MRSLASTSSAPTPEAIKLDNAACRVGNAGMAAIEAGDWESMRSLLRDDVISDDRRRSVGSRGVGADAYVKNFRTLWDLGMRSARNEVVAIRGENLALGRSALVDGKGMRSPRSRWSSWPPTDSCNGSCGSTPTTRTQRSPSSTSGSTRQATAGGPALRTVNLFVHTTGATGSGRACPVTEELVLVDHRPGGLSGGPHRRGSKYRADPGYRARSGHAGCDPSAFTLNEGSLDAWQRRGLRTRRAREPGRVPRRRTCCVAHKVRSHGVELFPPDQLAGAPRPVRSSLPAKSDDSSDFGHT